MIHRWRWYRWWLWTREWKWKQCEADVTKVEQVIKQIEEEDVDMRNIVKEKTSNESKNSATIQRKQKLKSQMIF